jgi:hypothetical protein
MRIAQQMMIAILCSIAMLANVPISSEKTTAVLILPQDVELD